MISQTKIADSGNYYLGITNPIGDSVSPNINVVVTPNTIPPPVEAVIPLGTPNTDGSPPNTLVKVVFTARVDHSTGSDPAKYTFSPSLTISSMTLLGSGRRRGGGLFGRRLAGSHSGHLRSDARGEYTLTVSGVKDQSQTPLTIPASTNSFRGPMLTPGMVNWDYYYLGTRQGGTVGCADRQVNYPNAPQNDAYITAFDTDQITGGDLNNNPALRRARRQLRRCISGWITPTVRANTRSPVE